VLGEPAAALRPARLVDDRVEPARADRLASTPETCTLAELGEQMASEDRPDTVDRLQRQATTVGASEATQLRLEEGVRLPV